MPRTFSEIIKNYRKEKQLSQDELSVHLNVDRSTISKWENERSSPELKDIPKLAGKISVEPEELAASIEETRGRNSVSSILGKYELFQWSYVYDQRIMKTNIEIKQGYRGLKFEERVTTGRQNAIIRGTVSVLFQNMFLFGKSEGFYKECELIIAKLPMFTGAWLMGVVAGVSSDGSNFPSASRVVLHYLGDSEFAGPPDYLPMKDIQLPGEYKKFLAERPEIKCPILSSRPLD